MTQPFSKEPINVDSLIIDTKRGLVTNRWDLTPEDEQLYVRGFFQNQRPDLTQIEYDQWKQKIQLVLIIAEQYFGHMSKRFHQESRRLNRYLGMGIANRSYYGGQEEAYYQLNNPGILLANPTNSRSWDENSKVVNYIDKILYRVNSYGFDQIYSLLFPRGQGYTRETQKEMEDHITQQLIKEMRKPPKE